MKMMLAYVKSMCTRSTKFCDRDTDQMQVPRNVLSPTTPHPISNIAS